MNSYEFIIKGHVEKHNLIGFDNLDFKYPGTGLTIITGNVKDQSELYGLIQRIKERGITLIKLEQIN